MTEKPLLQTIPSPRKVKLAIVGLTLVPTLFFATWAPFLVVPYFFALVFILLYHTTPFARVVNSFLPRYVNFISSRIRGRWGRILGVGSSLLDANFEGYWMIEENSTQIDLSSTRSTLAFFWKRKWDLILPPAFLAAVSAALVIELVKFFSEETIEKWKTEAVLYGGNPVIALVLLFGFIVPIIAILFYYPLIWGISDAEVKRYVIDNKTGEVTLVMNVGENLKRIFNAFAGGGSIAAVASWVNYIQGEEEMTFLGFLVVEFLIILILALTLLPAMVLLLFFYVNLFHGALVNFIRIGLKNEGIPFGTFQFNRLNLESTTPP
ncbi:MAG: hypothetical protein ACXAB4_01765 [Candidatus Hodarchaeales archaeon]|jgi:hypothetical protein